MNNIQEFYQSIGLTSPQKLTKREQILFNEYQRLQQEQSTIIVSDDSQILAKALEDSLAENASLKNQGHAEKLHRWVVTSTLTASILGCFIGLGIVFRETRVHQLNNQVGSLYGEISKLHDEKEYLKINNALVSENDKLVSQLREERYGSKITHVATGVSFFIVGLALGLCMVKIDQLGKIKKKVIKRGTKS